MLPPNPVSVPGPSIFQWHHSSACGVRAAVEARGLASGHGGVFAIPTDRARGKAAGNVFRIAHPSAHTHCMAPSGLAAAEMAIAVTITLGSGVAAAKDHNRGFPTSEIRAAA